MIITNSRYALVGYFITSYPTRAHGIIVNYFLIEILASLLQTTLFYRTFGFINWVDNKQLLDEVEQYIYIDYCMLRA